jgi:hypothetical protein
MYIHRLKQQQQQQQQQQEKEPSPGEALIMIWEFAVACGMGIRSCLGKEAGTNIGWK